MLYYRNGNPLLFEGDLQNEQSVLEWLIDDDNRELADEIEEVNDRMLERLMAESTLLVVFFCKSHCYDKILGMRNEVSIGIFQMMKTVRNVKKFWKNWRKSMARPICLELTLSRLLVPKLPKLTKLSIYLHWYTLGR